MAWHDELVVCDVDLFTSRARSPAFVLFFVVRICVDLVVPLLIKFWVLLWSILALVVVFGVDLCDTHGNSCTEAIVGFQDTSPKLPVNVRAGQLGSDVAYDVVFKVLVGHERLEELGDESSRGDFVWLIEFYDVVGSKLLHTEML
jgi:hypothetical protein